MELKSLQHQFLQQLLQQNLTPAASASGLKIYADAYYKRLITALRTHFPILQKFLGDSAFTQLAYLYLKVNPSCSPSLRWFGDRLADFLAQEPNYSALPYLSELAKLEWTVTLTYDAADSGLVNTRFLENMAPEQWPNMRFGPHPSLHLVYFAWNVVALWESMEKTHESLDCTPLDSPQAWLFWRKDQRLQYCLLAKDEACALSMMQKGLTFGKICEELQPWHVLPVAAFRAATWLKSWINAGLITHII